MKKTTTLLMIGFQILSGGNKAATNKLPHAQEQPIDLLRLL
jgi:hypothetical protein